MSDTPPPSATTEGPAADAAEPRATTAAIATASPHKKSLARTSLLLLPAQIVFRGGEAVFPWLLSTWFGRSHATDVYTFAWAIFTFAGSLVFSAYQDSALVPMLAEIRERHPEQLPRFRGALLAHTVVYGSGLALLVAVVAAAYFTVIYSGHDRAMAELMVPAFLVYLLALSLKTFFGAQLNAEHRYFALPIASACGTAVAVGSLAFLRSSGPVVIPYAQLAGELVTLTLLGSFARGLGFEWTLTRPPALVRAGRLIASEVFGAAVTRVNPSVDQLFAGLVGVAGGGTLLRLTGDVGSLPTSILQAAMLSVLLSHLSDDAARRHYASFRAKTWGALRVTLASLAASCLALHFARRPLLELVFLHGAMDAGGVTTLGDVLPYYLLGVPAFGALLVLVRAHVAAQNSRIMVKIGVLNAALNFLGNAVLGKLYGLAGLALSTSLVHAVVAALLYVLLRKHLQEIEADHP
ncbi:MAG: hypothetical protein IPF92_05770 [Myxococcales bacterium]|nr:hypothetical protein [Myxococcales bacterium]MBL0198077.1 hypothetical protein [Myxococcales bacterium]HQY61583.1 lipid II flippase MurJ [Polyangiaceae bacterium]